MISIPLALRAVICLARMTKKYGLKEAILSAALKDIEELFIHTMLS
jgi:hypothetical protein